MSGTFQRRPNSGEQGFVLVVVVIVMALLLVVVTAAVDWSASASATARRDAFQQQALAAAQTGMRMAVYETNGLGLDLGSTVNPASLTNTLLPGQCVVQTSSQISAIGSLSATAITASFATDGGLNVGGSWCGPIRATLGNGETYCYQVSPLVLVNTSTSTILSNNSVNLTQSQSLKFTREIVASGTAGGETRWVYETIQSPYTSNLGNILNLVSGSGSLNVQLYKPVSGTYTEGQPSTQPSGGFTCP